MVSVLAFYSNNPSSNPAGYFNFLYEKTKINKKEAGGWPIFKKSAGSENCLAKDLNIIGGFPLNLKDHIFGVVKSILWFIYHQAPPC